MLKLSQNIQTITGACDHHLSSKASWEAEIRKIMVLGQPRQIVLETTPRISKTTSAKWTGGVAKRGFTSTKLKSSNPSQSHQKK
jgi:hypothetical protein